jgi:hypothetical protein
MGGPPGLSFHLWRLCNRQRACSTPRARRVKAQTGRTHHERRGGPDARGCWWSREELNLRPPDLILQGQARSQLRHSPFEQRNRHVGGACPTKCHLSNGPRMTEEILQESWTARETLSKEGRPWPRITGTKVPVRTWSDYCRDIGSSRQMVNRWHGMQRRMKGKDDPNAQAPDDRA